MDVIFNGRVCVLKKEKYRKGGAAIRLFDTLDETPVATASVWIEGLAPDEIAIKDYSENTGMLISLVAAGVVSRPHRVHNGFPIVKLEK